MTFNVRVAVGIVANVLRKLVDVALGQIAISYDVVRRNFLPTEGLSGVTGFCSRFTNLWRSCGRGKIIIVMSVLLILAFSPCSDRGVDFSFEEVGYKNVRPASKTPDGRPVYRLLPSFSEVSGPFVVEVFAPPMSRSQALKNPSPYVRYEFPSSRDKKGRAMTYQKFKDDEEIRLNSAKACFRANEIIDGLDKQGYQADMDFYNRCETREKQRSITDRQHDYDMAHTLEMTLPQYEKYKNTRDWIYPSNSGLYKGGDAEFYQVDSNGHKWWLYKGSRVPVH